MKTFLILLLLTLVTPLLAQSNLNEEEMLYGDDSLQDAPSEITTPRSFEREPGGEFIDVPREEQEYDPNLESFDEESEFSEDEEIVQ